MKHGTEVAISIPVELLERIEAERRLTGESRSEFIRRAVAALLRADDERRADEEYIAAHRKYPETSIDVWLDNPLGRRTRKPP